MDFDLRSVQKYFEFVKSTRNAQLLSEAVADDLELDLLFLHTDRTTSKIGQQYLYSYFRLLNFGDSENKFPTEIFKKDAGLCSFAKQELKKIGEPSDYQIMDLIRDDLFANENYYRYAQFALPAIILIIICAFIVPKTVLLLLPFFAVNAYFHYSNKNYVDYYNIILSRLKPTLRTAENLAKIDGLSEDYDKIKLHRLRKAIRFGNVENALAQNEFLVVFWLLAEFFRILFITEIFTFRSRVKVLNQSKSELLKLYEFIGKTDAAIALVEIQREHRCCEPAFLQEKHLDIQSCYHPSIENCVENSLFLNSESAAITGSNMSGKTSFMRTVAVNVLFAQNFGFCFAEKYTAPKMQIYSSIAIQDDIGSSKSYYLEEVLRIRNFLEKRDYFALILIDEIFKGTNTQERIAISKSVLEDLNSENNIVIVTTHDLQIARHLEDFRYRLFFFDEQIGGGNLVFPYKLKYGINQKTNAIRVLEMYDYPKNITERAKSLL